MIEFGTGGWRAAIGGKSESGGRVIARFPGSEPLMRVFCEMPPLRKTQEVSGLLEEFLGLAQ